MKKQEHFRITAKPEELTAAMNWLEYSGTELGLRSQLLLRLQLVTEELFLNTLQHGYGAPCDAAVQLSLTLEAGQVCLTYIDHAPAFNPCHPSAPSAPGQAGAGLALICQLPDQIDYVRLANGNQISLRFCDCYPQQ